MDLTHSIHRRIYHNGPSGLSFARSEELESMHKILNHTDLKTMAVVLNAIEKIIRKSSQEEFFSCFPRLVFLVELREKMQAWS